MTNARYALRTTAIQDCRAMWSTGSYWMAEVPAAADLMTGPEADAFAARHPNAQIVDVVVYRAARDVWNAGYRSVVPYGFKGKTTEAQRAEARAAGDAAVAAAGYRSGVLKAA